MNLPLSIAKRYITKQKGSFSSFIIKLAIGATALSVAVMILSVCIVSGFKSVIREKLYSFWGHCLVVPYSDNPANIMGFNPIYKDAGFVQELKQQKHISDVAPFIVRPAIIQANNEMEGVRLKGIDKQYHIPPALHLKGNGFTFSDSTYTKQIILSQTTADRLQLKIGDPILLYFLEQGSITPRIRKLQLAGIYHTGMEDIDQFLAFCDIKLLQQINGWEANQINGYQLTLTNAAFSHTVADSIYKNSNLNTQTIEDTFPGIIDWLNIQDTSVSILMVIMGAVAIISMGSALIILIVERAAITGLLKALGMQNKSLQSIFLYIAALTGGAGVLLGNVFAIGICLAQQKWKFIRLDETTYFMDSVPIKMEWTSIMLINIITIGITVLCMYIPTRYVRNQQPAKVLRFK